MFKYTSLLVLVSVQMIHAFSTGQVDGGDHGYRKVAKTEISHCGKNTTQQCFHFETPIKNVNITNDGKLDIACTQSGLCAFGFDFEKQNANVTINCLNLQGKEQNSTVQAEFGKTDTPNGVKYANYVVRGDDISAKWKSEKYYTLFSAVSVLCVVLIK